MLRAVDRFIVGWACLFACACSFTPDGDAIEIAFPLESDTRLDDGTVIGRRTVSGIPDLQAMTEADVNVPCDFVRVTHEGGTTAVVSSRVTVVVRATNCDQGKTGTIRIPTKGAL